MGGRSRTNMGVLRDTDFRIEPSVCTAMAKPPDPGVRSASSKRLGFLAPPVPFIISTLRSPQAFCVLNDNTTPVYSPGVLSLCLSPISQIPRRQAHTRFAELCLARFTAWIVRLIGWAVSRSIPRPVVDRNREVRAGQGYQHCPCPTATCWYGVVVGLRNSSPDTTTDRYRSTRDCSPIPA